MSTWDLRHKMLRIFTLIPSIHRGTYLEITGIFYHALLPFPPTPPFFWQFKTVLMQPNNGTLFFTLSSLSSHSPQLVFVFFSPFYLFSHFFPSSCFIHSPSPPRFTPSKPCLSRQRITVNDTCILFTTGSVELRTSISSESWENHSIKQLL